MDILTQIIDETRRAIEEQRSKVNLATVRQSAENVSAKSEAGKFRKALHKSQIEIIAEIKRASPSRGIICPRFDPVQIAHEYEKGGAAAISVLTEQKYFHGSIGYLADIAEHVDLPLLRKDFIIDEYQIYEAAANSANAVLLIAAVLSEQQIRDFLSLIHSLKMDALVEIHNQDELTKSLYAGADIVGINNRDLRTFETDLGKSLMLVKEIPPENLKVSESGITLRKDVCELESAGFDAVLIGETLMRKTDRTAFLQKLRGVSCG